MSTKWINHNTNYEKAKINLFCFPHAGSSSTFFAPWVKYFTDEINIFPVQYPERDNRMQESMPDSLVELAEKMVQESEELFDRPFIFLGHCSGSIIAFEAAQCVRRQYDREPEMLFVSASVAPEKYRLKSTKNLPDDAFFKYYHFPKDKIDKDNPLFNFFLPIIRKDFMLCEKYRYEQQAPLTCPIYAMGGDADYAVDDISLIDEWKDYTTNPVFIKKIYEGDHFYFERNTEDICKNISEQISHII